MTVKKDEQMKFETQNIDINNSNNNKSHLKFDIKWPSIFQELINLRSQIQIGRKFHNYLSPMFLDRM